MEEQEVVKVTKMEQVINYYEMERLEDGPLEIGCLVHGVQHTTIGEFVTNGILCHACAKNLPLMHKDFMVDPVIEALLKEALVS